MEAVWDTLVRVGGVQISTAKKAVVSWQRRQVETELGGGRSG